MRRASKSVILATVMLIPAGTALAQTQFADDTGFIKAHSPGGGYGSGWGGSNWHDQMHAWMQQQGGGPGYGMGPGMMGPGYGMGPGMMSPGYGMGAGMPGPGMMRPGYGMSPGMMYGTPQSPGGQISVEDVRDVLEQMVGSNPNLKVGNVAEQDGEITAEVVTQDGSLVNRFRVNPNTGRWAPEY